MNYKKLSLILACAALTGIGATSCNEPVQWKTHWDQCKGIEGKTFCYDNSVISCSDKGEYSETPCENGQVCTLTEKDGAVCMGECQNDDTKCESLDNGSVIVSKCIDGLWVNSNESCEVCAANGKVCAECTADDTKCETTENGSVVVSKCIDGLWKNTNEACEACAADGKVCAVCTDLATKCETTDDGSVVVSRCIDGLWTNTNEACSACADNGIECAECTTDDTKCETAEDGSISVSNCIGGLWGNSNESCEVCAANGKVCAECTADDTKCETAEDGTVVVSKCVDGLWVNSNESCEACADNGKVCAECTTDDSKCETAEDGSVNVSNCIEGIWTSSNEDCSNKVCDKDLKACVDNVCDYEKADSTSVKIPDGAQICDGNIIVSCKDFETTKSTPCEIGICLEDNDGAASCIPQGCSINETTIEHEGTICFQNKQLKCFDGETDEGTECAEGWVCADGEITCRAGNRCEDADIAHLAIICDDNHDVVQCYDGNIQTIEDCDSDNADETLRTFCSSLLKCESAGADDCQPTDSTPLVKNGENVCVGDVLKTCTVRVLSEGDVCPESTPVCDTNECRAYNQCNIGTESEPDMIDHNVVTCLADQSQKATCTDGVLVAFDSDDAEACVEHQICVIDETDDAAKCVCTDAANLCIQNGNNAEVTTCEDTGLLSENTVENVSCIDDHTVGECLNDTTVCVEGSGVHTCASGVWGEYTACEFSCSTDKTACNLCAVNTKKCDNLQPQICSAQDSGNYYTNNGEACKFDCIDGVCNDTDKCAQASDCDSTGSVTLESNEKWECNITSGDTIGKCEVGYKPCDGSSWNGGSSYSVPVGQYGCVDANNYFYCNNGIMENAACAAGSVCNDSSAQTNDAICVECMSSTECDGKFQYSTQVECNASHTCELKECQDGYKIVDNSCVLKTCKDSTDPTLVDICGELPLNGYAWSCSDDAECVLSCNDHYKVEGDACVPKCTCEGKTDANGTWACADDDICHLSCNTGWHINNANDTCEADCTSSVCVGGEIYKCELGILATTPSACPDVSIVGALVACEDDHTCGWTCDASKHFVKSLDETSCECDINNGYVLDGDECKQHGCTDIYDNLVLNNHYGCKTMNIVDYCQDEEWVDGEVGTLDDYTTTLSCGNYICDGATGDCKTSCTSDDDCFESVCDTIDGVCKKQCEYGNTTLFEGESLCDEINSKLVKCNEGETVSYDCATQCSVVDNEAVCLNANKWICDGAILKHIGSDGIGYVEADEQDCGEESRCDDVNGTCLTGSGCIFDSDCSVPATGAADDHITSECVDRVCRYYCAEGYIENYTASNTMPECVDVSTIKCDIATEVFDEDEDMDIWFARISTIQLDASRISLVCGELDKPISTWANATQVIDVTSEHTDSSDPRRPSEHCANKQPLGDNYEYAANFYDMSLDATKSYICNFMIKSDGGNKYMCHGADNQSPITSLMLVGEDTTLEPEEGWGVEATEEPPAEKCTSTYTACDADLKVLIKCVEGEDMVKETCGTTEQCLEDKENEGEFKCTSIIETHCNPNLSRCSGDTLLTCNDAGTAEIQTDCTEYGKVCEVIDHEADCVPPLTTYCRPNTTRCDGNVLYTCSFDGSDETQTDCTTLDTNGFCGEMNKAVCMKSVTFDFSDSSIQQTNVGETNPYLKSYQSGDVTFMGYLSNDGLTINNKSGQSGDRGYFKVNSLKGIGSIVVDAESETTLENNYYNITLGSDNPFGDIANSSDNDISFSAYTLPPDFYTTTSLSIETYGNETNTDTDENGRMTLKSITWTTAI